MTYRTAACQWQVDPACCPCEDAENNTPAWQRSVAMATELLWVLTGRQFGLCEVTVRPCLGNDSCGGHRSILDGWSGQRFLPWQGGSVGVWTPSLINGKWVNCRSCGSDCCDVCELDLPFGPACDVVSVQLDGRVLDPREYRIDDYRRLVRVGVLDPVTDTVDHDAGTCWPSECQDLNKPPTEDGTFAVTYRWGVPVPELGRGAAGQLACEFLKACNDDDDCKLPDRVATISRQGITMTLIDTGTDLFRDGKTGLYLVDRFIGAYNPYGLKERSRVWSPELARRKRSHRLTTWPSP